MPNAANLPTQADAAKQPFMATRVDAAHPLREAAADVSPSPHATSAATGDEQDRALLLVQQVRSQAAQLASHLERQQSGLDHRESELNSRQAGIESQMRAARLWLSERQSALAHREADVERREQELEAQNGQPAREISNASEPSPQRDAHSSAPKLRLQDPSDAERAEARIQELEKRLASSKARDEHLDKAEALLAAQQIELEGRCRQLDGEREASREETEAQRRELAEDRTRITAELDEQRQSLKRRGDELEAKRIAVKQLQAEVTRVQRDTLEMRLATEELWARLCGTMAPAALTHSLSQLRLQMADQNRLAQQEIAERMSELQSLAARLDEQHEKLARQRQELQAWVQRRREEIDEQASILVRREADLERQESEFREHARAWDSERNGYQKEIRRLLRHLRRGEAAAA